MDPALFWLAATLAVTALFSFPHVLNRIAVRGLPTTLANATASTDDAPAPWAQRTKRAHAHAAAFTAAAYTVSVVGLRTLCFFAGLAATLVIIARVLGWL